MKTKLLALLFLVGSSMFGASRFYLGIGIGGYAPRPIAVYAPPPAPVYEYYRPAPGHGYTWVAGYWYPSGPRYVWRSGYWARPPYARALWVAPRWHGRHYYPGYWRRR